MWKALLLLILITSLKQGSASNIVNESTTVTLEIKDKTNQTNAITYKHDYLSSTLVPVTFKEGKNLLLNCTEGNYKKIIWFKNNKKIFPKTRFDSYLNLKLSKNGKSLFINRAHPSDSGTYTCKTEKNEIIQNFRVIVTSKNTSLHTTISNFSTNEMTTFRLPITTEPTFKDSVKNVQDFFECSDGKRVNKSMRCDYNTDCKDGSDEENCEFFHPKITMLPDLEVKLLCGSDEIHTSQTLKLTCEFSGHPQPIVKWKRYDGHVPSKCQQISERGRGTLICHNFKQADQGAYSCIGENSEGSGQSQPKSMVKCRNYISCKGFKILDEDGMEHCLDCFCSGKSNQCESIKSKPLFTTINLSDSKVEIFAKDDGDIVFIPSNSQIAPDPKIRETAKSITYCELSADDIKENSLLKSYGRKLRLPKQSKYNEKNKFLPGAPDLILKGNNIPLLYHFNYIPTSMPFVDVKFWQGNWMHLNKTHATRKDIMMALSDFESFLIRCEYKAREIENSKTMYITLETSAVTNSSDSSGYLEKCNCPLGYSGLSCENCADGYEKIETENNFVCKLKSCDHSKGFYWDGIDCKKSSCNVDGSISLKPDKLGQCQCKENVIGKNCDKCINGYFNVRNCLKCFCSGVSNICESTTLKRTIISSTVVGGYNVTSNSVSSGKNFWLLPSLFSGNRLASYGGYIKYGMKYRPNIKKQTSVLSVELLTAEDFTLTFIHPDIDTSTDTDSKTWVVDLKEHFWKKADKNIANRSEFLEVLANLKAIYIESPYHLAQKLVNLTFVHMSDAKDISDDGSETAYEVEKCQCPVGYKGLSCEECEEGFSKVKGSNFCKPCDPNRGCSDCPQGHFRSNPETEKIPICKKCHCNGNEEKCGVDINNKPFCICKSGYGGFNCENKISVNSSHLIVQISPSKLSLSQLGSMITFNCSYLSSDEMTLSFTKIFAKEKKGPFVQPLHLLNSTKSKFGSAMIWTTHLETDLVQIECNINNLKGKEVGKIVSIVDKIDLIQVPVKITNCYSNTITVKETKSQDLICTASGKPEPKITWYVKRANGSLEEVNSVNGVHSIENAKLKQNGTEFICQAKNEIQDIQTCSITLIVTKNCDTVHITPKSLTIFEEDTIVLKCTSTSNHPVIWSGLNFSLPFFKTEEKGILTIKNAKTSYSGTYVCKVLSNGGYINSTVNVSVIEKKIFPTAFISKNDVNLKVGENFEVDCYGTGKPSPTVSWINPLTLLSNVIIRKGNLKINNASLLNSGIYECQASSSEGTHTSRLLINVTENRVKPKIVIVTTQESIFEGSNVTLKCVIKEGNPLPSLYWSKYDKGQFSSVKPNGIIQENGTLLIFQNISRKDSGLYVCTAKNSMGQDESKKEINVLYKPEVTVSHEEIIAIENENITITCTAIGNPKPTLKIENRMKSYKKRYLGKNNELAKMEDLKQLTLTIPVESDLEAVICIGSNIAGTTKKEIKITVTVLAEETLEHAIRVPIGSFHEIMCYNCSGKLKWEKLSISKSKKSLVGDECNIKDGLMIESIQIQHEGTYVCTCDNDPNFKKEFTLIVYGFTPKFVQKSNSYLIVPATLKSNKKLRLELSFKTNHSNGMLLHHEDNKFLIYIHNYKIVVVFFFNNIISAFTSDKRLSDGIFYSLVLDVNVPTVVMTIYDEDANIFEKKTEEKLLDSKFELESFSNIFVGGTKHHNNAVTHRFLPRHFLSLSGCISRLNINNHELDIVKDGNYSSKVTLCEICSTQKNPCEGKGKCLDAPTHSGFVCLCPESSTIKGRDSCPVACKGRNCDGQLDLCNLLKPCNESNSNGCFGGSLSSLECHCSTGFSGLTCNEEKKNTICFRGEGYAKLPSKYLDRPNLREPQIISMEFFINKPNGLLLFQGDNENNVSISVYERKVKYLFFNQNTTLKIVSSPISFDSKHQLTIKRSNGTVIFTLDRETIEDHIKFTTNRIYGPIYLGGVPRNNYYYHKGEGLYGGIRFITFGQQPKINFRKNALAIVNDIPCEHFEQYKNEVEYEESGDSSDYDYNFS